MRIVAVLHRGPLLQLAAWLGALSCALPVRAYESYHDPSQNDQGYCATCHPGFGGGLGDALHALHTGGSDPVTQNCNLCHTGAGRDNPLTMWSVGNGLGCMGCHGQDYGETIEANYRTFNTAGQHKQSGYGLRRHHARAGITICGDCHDNNVPPYGEDVIDTGLGFTAHYFTRTDVQLGSPPTPVNPCTNEDSANDTDSTGLDNDGDGLYDGEDPDCTGAPVTLTVETSSSETVLSWPYTFDGWHVQTSTEPVGIWVDLPNVPVETPFAWTVTLEAAQGTRFFRLNKTR